MASEANDIEKFYDIFSCSQSWSEPKQEGKDYPDPWLKNQPEGFFKNGCGISYFTSQEQAVKAAKNWMKSRKEKTPGCKDFRNEIKFSHRETWVPGWFHHWTYPEGRTDEQLEYSFVLYIDRMQRYNREHGKVSDSGYWLDAICLMGAEDRWRWTAGPDQPSDLVICRCEGCTKSGIVRISH